ncbi:MAG: RNA polymerase sigma factor [Planctomycetota bacterium]|jgi:RNA polymerase sigma-70 factor (ECF subfamily)
MDGDAPASEGELLELARGGDVEAFGRLVEENQDYIYNAVYHLVANEKDAEDIAQEVFVKAFRRLSSFEGRARFSTWLYGIMLNAVRSFWRRSRRRRTVSLAGTGRDGDAPNPDPPAEGDGPLEGSVRRERVSAVRAAIGTLDEQWREVIVLRDIRGFSYEEMAETLGLPAGTVKSRLHRARHALRERLEPLFGAPD